MLKCTPFGQEPNTDHNRQREPLRTTGLKGKEARTEKKGIEEETLHSRALQDIFFIKLLLSRARDIADFPNTQKKTQS